MARPCPHCGQDNPSAARFCRSCGRAFAPVQPVPVQQPQYRTPQQQPQYQQPIPQPPVPLPVPPQPPKKGCGGCGCLLLLLLIGVAIAMSISVARSKTYMQHLKIEPAEVIPVPPGGFSPPKVDDRRGEIDARVHKIDPAILAGMFHIVRAERTASGFRTTRDDGRRGSTAVVTLQVLALTDLDFSNSHFAVADARDPGHSVPSAVHANPGGQLSDQWTAGQTGQIIICIDEYAYSTSTLFALRVEEGSPNYPRLLTVR